MDMDMVMGNAATAVTINCASVGHVLHPKSVNRLWSSTKLTTLTLQPRMEDKELDDLIRMHTGRLRAFVRGRVGNREDAEDIVQDTLLQLLRTLRILENPIGQVTSWLFTVAPGSCHRETTVMKQLLCHIRLWLSRLSFRTGVIVLLCCIPCYILSFAQMALPISTGMKSVLWFVLFGMAKTLQYGGLTILGVEGVKRLKMLFGKS